MRILHTSDWHLGRTLHGIDLREHQAAFVDHLVELVRAEEVDVVLVAGDVYDRAVPPVESVSLLSSALARLSEHASVVLTSGNHDSARRLGFGAQVLRDGVHVRTTPDVDVPVAVTGRDGTRAYVYPFPYLEPDEARVTLARETDDDGAPVLLGRSHEAVVGAAMDLVRADVSRRREIETEGFVTVVMAHAFVVGGAPSESERPIAIGGVDSVPAGVFTGVDYVALGHLHGPQQVTVPGGTARYSGSPLAYSFSERGHRKSSVVVDLVPGEPATTRLVDAPVPRRLSEVRGELEVVLSERYAAQREDWVRVYVTDEVPPPRYLERVREVFPHALVVLRDPAAGTRGAAAFRAVTAASDPVDVASDFVAHVTGTAPTADEVAVLRETFEQLARAERDR